MCNRDGGSTIIRVWDRKDWILQRSLASSTRAPCGDNKRISQSQVSIGERLTWSEMLTKQKTLLSIKKYRTFDWSQPFSDY